MNFFPLNFWFVTNTRQVMEHFKLVFGSGNSDLAKIRPLKVWTSWISPWVPPYMGFCLIGFGVSSDKLFGKPINFRPQKRSTVSFGSNLMASSSQSLPDPQRNPR